MNKILKAMGCVLVSGSLLLATACGGGKKSDSQTETRPLNLAIGALDGNYNPFFYTSANDGEVIAMTQASMLSVDPSGEPAVGENYPVVTKALTTTYYTEKKGGSVTDNSAEAAVNGRTEYDFLIKNGMKFSDGTDLTIKDVLFNFYVYLDPVYTGSNTMYSVDIQGLAAYQSNDNSLDVDDEVNNSAYESKARARIQAIIDWSDGESSTVPPKDDIDLVASLYKEELTSDWTAIETSWQETYETNYSFTHAWQAYLFQEGIVTVQEKMTDKGTTYQIRVDANGNEVDPSSPAYETAKNLTTLDPWAVGATEAAGHEGMIERQAIIDDIAKLTKDVSEDSYEYIQLTKKYCIDYIYSTINTETGSGFGDVLRYWATASTAYSSFVADERGKAIKDSSNPRYYISGIRTYKTNTFNGVNLGEDHYVLKIVINGVDPAAIWNFGISIAPIHYYSGTYDGVNYINEATAWSNGGVATKEGQFGVKRGEFNFFEKVVKGTDSGKSALPVGAGAYQASSLSGNPTRDGNSFESNNIVYYQRNEYFHTMGTGIENAKIKYLRYKVLADDRIIPSLESGAIDYGQPGATPTNLSQVDGKGKYGVYHYATSGYGYVGINPTYVPDVNIRRAIMKAMTISEAVSYYGSLAEPIYRPMSTTSWAYPDLDVLNPTYQGLETLSSGAEIENYLKGLGYKRNGSSWTDPSGNSVKTSYTFTIAGATSDHPAYKMFTMAENILEQAGFNITVSTSATALRDLTRGTVAIWAAAYSTGIDPDLYQLYHKDSQATSVLNWGYNTILIDSTGKYYDEQLIIEELSEKIELARTTLDQKARKNYYSQCLDLIMELAIQLPIYQRQDLCVFNKNVIDENSVNKNANYINGVLNEIWKVDYVK